MHLIYDMQFIYADMQHIYVDMRDKLHYMSIACINYHIGCRYHIFYVDITHRKITCIQRTEIYKNENQLHFLFAWGCICFEHGKHARKSNKNLFNKFCKNPPFKCCYMQNKYGEK